MNVNLRRRRVFAGVLLVLLFPAVTAWAAPAETASERAFRSFDSWLQSYLSTTSAASTTAAPESSVATAEAVSLAKQRRQALKELARTDPREALARALPPSVIKRLPPAIQQEAESYVDACGTGLDVNIADDFGKGDTPVSRVSRTLTVGTRTYEAQVFGKRLATPSKAIHANGIVIDGMVVLYESPMRRLDPEEAAADPTVRARCGAPGPSCIAVKVGAQTLVFPDEESLKRHQSALEKDEAKLGLHHPAGREEALDPREDQIGVTSVWTTGEKTVLYIRVDFSDRPGDPVAGGHRSVHHGRRRQHLLPGHLLRQDLAARPPSSPPSACRGRRRSTRRSATGRS